MYGLSKEELLFVFSTINNLTNLANVLFQFFIRYRIVTTDIY